MKIEVKDTKESISKDVKTENDIWCLWPQFSQLLLSKISKVKTVLKSSGEADFFVGHSVDYSAALKFIVVDLAETQL